MSFPCPDQDRSLRVGLYKCPYCGAQIEIFSNEDQVKCYECNQLVYREKLSPCIEWCASARQCLEEEKRKRGREKGGK